MNRRVVLIMLLVLAVFLLLFFLGLTPTGFFARTEHSDINEILSEIPTSQFVHIARVVVTEGSIHTIPLIVQELNQT